MNVNEFFAQRKARQEKNNQLSIEKLNSATHDALEELYRELTWELTEDIPDHLSIFTEDDVDKFFAKPLPHMEILAMYIEMEKNIARKELFFSKDFPSSCWKS